MPGRTVHPAAPSDAATLSDVARDAYRAYVARMQGQRPAPMDADYAEAIDRDCVWVAEADGTVAGFIVLVDRPGEVLVENVAVRPALQGRGVGRSLMRLAEDRARERGVERVCLFTNEAMIENQLMYLRLGYTEIDRRLDLGFSRVFYEKRVGS